MKKETDDPISLTLPCKNYFEVNIEILNNLMYIIDLAQQKDKLLKGINKLYIDPKPEHLKKAPDSETFIYLKKNRHFFFQLFLCKAVDNYLSYISELIGLIFIEKPETLKSKETVKLDFILNHNNFNELVKEIAEVKINELSYKGLNELDDYLKDKINFPLFNDSLYKTKAIEVVEIRNIFIHNRGTVNKVFLNRVKSKKYKIGQSIMLEEDLAIKISELENHVRDLDKRAIKKFKLTTKKVKQPIYLGLSFKKSHRPKANLHSTTTKT